MNQVFKSIIATTFLTLTSLQASLDDRLGFNTHWDQGSPPDLQATLIPVTGVAWVRDNIGWAQTETSKGSYALTSRDIHWLQLAQANGLSVDVCVLGPNNIYADPYDPQAFANFIGWLTTQMKAYPCVKVIEVLNEPNNFYAPYEKTPGFTDYRNAYVNLLNLAYISIKTANPNITVIGLGDGTPANNYYMIGLHPSLDGVVDHPYMGSVPEQGFSDRVKGYRNLTSKPLWFTEFGKSTQYGANNAWHETENQQAIEMLRQIFLGFALKVEHQFIYEFNDELVNPYDNQDNFGVFGNGSFPKQLYYDLENTVPVFIPAWNIRTPDQAFWGFYGQSAGFDQSNFITYGFQTNKGDIIAYWFAVASWLPETGTVNTWWYHPGFSSVKIFDPLSGVYTYPSWSYGGDHNTVIVPITVSERPKLLIIK